ncbi:MAG: hypothetical protein PUA75_07410 [Clostridiales bacterium]|nr:hypothetical protein [Clostridiales bacterium]
MKKVIASLLVVTLMFNSFIQEVSAVETQSGIMETEHIYVDGIEYVYRVSTNGEIEIEAVSKNVEGKLTVDSDAQAVAEVLDENGDMKEYEIDINDLTDKNVDIDVFEDDGKIIEEYETMEELLEDAYECQTAATVTVTVISVSTLLKVLLLIAATVVVSGVVYYAATTVAETIQNNKKKRNLYYSAYLRGKDVYISYNKSISFKSAVSRVRYGKSIYTWTSANAKNVVLATGLGTIPRAEIDSASSRKKGFVYYYHWHTKNRNGAHAWFGRPYTK